ncbi:MAG: ferrochelatase, partial [Bacteroidota bacterium]
MTPRAFNKVFRYDKRLVTGDFFPQEPVGIEAGDRVGVVLLSPGGPIKLEDVERYLYNRYMDPACIDLPLKGAARHWASKFVASRWSKGVSAGYEAIGGASPINRLTEEQRVALERRLNDRFAPLTGASFRCYSATRYWKPAPEEIGTEMVRDGITKVVLLPLYPQYAKATTGSSLAYWKALEDTGEIPVWPTTLVYEYAAHPKYIQAISERIDEGLQRFPRAVREKVHLLFSAHGTTAKAMKQQRDPYCCLVHATVQQVMAYRHAEREPDRAFHVAFLGHQGPSEGLTPSTPSQLEELADQGHTAVLV